MAEEQFEQGIWERPSGDEFLAEKSEETLELLAALQRGLERFEPVRTIPDATRGDGAHAETSDGVISVDTPQLRRRLDAVAEALRRAERTSSAKSRDGAEVVPHGTLSVCRGRAPFLRGHVDRYVNVPLITTSNPYVAYFLQTIPNIGDKLKRENHAHFGIHYHYLNRYEARSNTILCFRPETEWPLFSERHAEKRSEFDARPGAWSERKRRSVYRVLKPETKRFRAAEFRRPSKEAAIVWKSKARSISDL